MLDRKVWKKADGLSKISEMSILLYLSEIFGNII